MAKKRFSETEIIAALKRSEAGVDVRADRA